MKHKERLWLLYNLFWHKQKINCRTLGMCTETDFLGLYFEGLSWRICPRGWRRCASLVWSTSLKPAFYTYFLDECLDMRKAPDPWCCSRLNRHLQVGSECLQNDLMCLMGCHWEENVAKPLKVFILSYRISFVILSSRFRDTFFSSRTLICGMWYFLISGPDSPFLLHIPPSIVLLRAIRFGFSPRSRRSPDGWP